MTCLRYIKDQKNNLASLIVDLKQRLISHQNEANILVGKAVKAALERMVGRNE